MDSTADFLTRIRNALTADQDDVVIPSSKLNSELAALLEREGYIEGFEHERQMPDNARTEFEVLRLRLKYTEDRRPVISGLQRVSKPGRRQYTTSANPPRVQGGMGTTIITTSRGVMTANQARRDRVGGEVLAYVW